MGSESPRNPDPREGPTPFTQDTHKSGRLAPEPLSTFLHIEVQCYPPNYSENCRSLTPSPQSPPSLACYFKKEMQCRLCSGERKACPGLAQL